MAEAWWRRQRWKTQEIPSPSAAKSDASARRCKLGLVDEWLSGSIGRASAIMIVRAAARCWVLAAVIASVACGQTKKTSEGAGSGATGGLQPNGAGGSVGEAALPGGVHLVLREQSRNLRSPSGVFSGDTLGVVGTAYQSLTGVASTVLAIERETGFVFSELGRNASLVPRIAPAPRGFFVLFGEKTELLLAQVDVDGLIRRRVQVGALPPYYHCGFAAFGEMAVAACDSDGRPEAVFSCSAMNCERLELEECENSRSSIEVVWDGQAFGIGRVCSVAGVPKLRWTRLLPGVATSVETSLPSPPVDSQGSAPALARRGDRVLLAYEGSLFEIEPASGAVEFVADARRPSKGGSFSSSRYTLWPTEDRTVLVDSFCDNGIEGARGDSAWRVLSAAGAELVPPELVSDRCGDATLAGADSGRVVLLRTASQSFVIEELDIAAGTRGPAQLVAAPAGDALVQAMTCDGPRCSLALYDPGIELSVPGTFQRVEVDEQVRDGTPIPSEGSPPVLLTAAGDTVVFEGGLSWLRPDLSVAWSEPWPSAPMVPAWDLGQPWAMLAQHGSIELWRLNASGIEKSSVPSAEDPSVCGTTHDLRFSSDSSGPRFEPLFNDDAARVTLPAGDRIICGAGQVATLSESADGVIVHRARASGELLPDEVFDGEIAALSADHSLLLLTTEAGPPGTPLSQRYTLFELSASEATRRFVLELPMPGAPATTGPCCSGAIQVQGGFIHFLWISESHLMLSRWPRE